MRTPLTRGCPLATLVAGAVVLGARVASATDPLPSWRTTAPKRAIVAFVTAVTAPGSPRFVPPEARVAVFDNDGTLWAEQPFYAQLFFAVDRVKAVAPQHPEWKDTEPFASVLKGDTEAALAGGDRALLELVMATHAGMTSQEFEGVVIEWIATARHPRTGRPFTEMVYQPMLDLLAFLRASGFKTYIVSGGGIEFIRPWAERVYGVPPEQVVGSSIRTRYEIRDGRPVLSRLPELSFIDDKAGKPVAINTHIGRRPLLAFGNSDGDFEMLEWTNTGPGARLALLLHHTDEEREWAYDRESSVGRLARGLDEAKTRGWMLVSMKDDWMRVFPSR